MSGEQEGYSGAGSRPALPRELTEFFAAGGRSLLVKGGAGTGKTTLALTLVAALQASGNFTYLSTRESPRLFRRDHPWIAQLIDPVGKTAGKQEEAAQPSFIDARLDEPTQLFERITSQLMDAQAPLVVVDTLDALRDFMDARTLKRNVRVLQTWCERAGARLIVTVEDPDSTSLDSLMDGVVLLKQRTAESRRIREIELVKLLGVRMGRPSHLFTLNGGWFRAFEEPADEDFVITPGAVIGPTPRRSTTKRARFAIGYGEIDGVLGGGCPPGGLLNLGLDHEVSMRIGFLFLAPMIYSFPGEGRILLAPLDGLEKDYLDRYLRLLPRSLQSRISYLKDDLSYDGEFRDGAPVLSIIGAAEAQALSRYASLARSSGGVTVWVDKGHEKPARGTPPFNNRITIRQVGGSLLAASEMPFSQYFGVTVVNRGGLPALELEPMV